MSVISPPGYEPIGSLEVTAASTVSATPAAHSALEHGVAISPAISFQVTVKPHRRKLKISGFLPYCGSTVVGNISWHIMLDGVCIRENAATITTASVGFGVDFTRVIDNVTAGVRTISLQLRVLTGSGTPIAFVSPTATNPLQILVEEVP